MKKFGSLILSFGLTIGLLGCGTNNTLSTDSNNHQEQSKNAQEGTRVVQENTKQTELPKVQLKGIRQKADGSLEIIKDGLTITTTQPTEGPSEVAWRYFKLLNEQQYEEASTLLQGFLYRSLHDEQDQTYLREIIGSQFVRMADITEIAPVENETFNAFARRVFYIEVELKLRGVVPQTNTGYRNGLNHFAIHIIQEKAGSPWRIVVIGGSPELEK